MKKNYKEISTELLNIEMAARLSVVDLLVNSLIGNNVSSMSFAEPITIDDINGDNYGTLDSFRIGEDEERGINTVYVSYTLEFNDGSNMHYDDRNIIDMPSLDIANFVSNIILSL